MNVTISRTYDFEAAHNLPHVPDGHKCKRVHGHSYTVEVQVTGPVKTDGAETGMVLDFGRLDAIWASIHKRIDHRPLNESVESNPTVEVVCPLLHEWFTNELRDAGFDLFVRVVLREGPRSVCIYPPVAL